MALTPGGPGRRISARAALATLVRKVVEEESKRLGLHIKVQEGAGVSLRRSLTTTDLKAGAPCPQGTLCLTGEGKGGLHHHVHHRSGAVYQGECLLCGDLVAKYWGESGDSAYCRTLQHQKSIANREKNAFAKHLLIHHPNQQGKQDAFKFSLLEIHGKPLPRLVSESCYIHGSKADHLKKQG